MEGSPDRIGPDMGPKKTFGDRMRSVKKAFLTKEGLIGNYDYAFLFTPNIPFVKRQRRAIAPFFALNTRMPVFLALLLGFQHSLAMLAGIITPPIILAGSGGANLTLAQSQYLVSTSLIVCGLLSAIQITRLHIYKTPYYIGTGLISVVGTSFAVIPVAQGALTQMYINGMCPVNPDTGARLPCPDGYGAILGTGAICSLVQILLSFTPPRILKKIFPPLVTGPTVMLIGAKLVASGFTNWAGGSGCSSRPTEGLFRLCPNINAPHPLPWGSAEFIGLGFSVFVTIILCERFGSPIMKSCAVVVGLLVGCIIAGATGYFDRTSIDSSPAVSFIWVHTFKLSIYAPIVLPSIAVSIVLTMEAIGDITATNEVSRLDTDLLDSRIQGGVFCDGLNSILATLGTITPVSTFAQNNGVIALTRCANRKAGWAACFWLVIMGIFAKFAAALIAIPSAVLGGMTTFLFASVAVSGVRIISTMEWSRRNRFILTASLTLGYGATLVPTWFSYVFTYEGDNTGLSGFLDAIELVMETGFAVTAFVTLILNLILPEEPEDEPLPELDGDGFDDASDTEEERNKISGATNLEKGAAGTTTTKTTKSVGI